MPNNNPVDQLVELLRLSSLEWLLPNLRQDSFVWDSLTCLPFIEKFVQVGSPGLQLKPDDFSPARLSLIALDQTNINNKSINNLLDFVDERTSLAAIRSLNDLKISHIPPRNLATAGLIALALMDKYQTTGSWYELISTIDSTPGSHWLSPLACLFGFAGKAFGLLSALVQPGASALRIDLAVHIVLSTPIPPKEQVDTVFYLCHGSYGDLVSPRERTLILRSLVEQRPQIARDFCIRWLEQYPDLTSNHLNGSSHPNESLDRLAEYLFNIEINKIAESENRIVKALDQEKEILGQLSQRLDNHYLSHALKYNSGKSLSEELIPIQDHISFWKEQNPKASTFTTDKAELALILADRGLYEEALKLIPETTPPYPNDPKLIYAIAKVSRMSGDLQRASIAADQLCAMIFQNNISQPVPIWDEYYSLENIGKLLLELHKYSQATRIFDLACVTCPNELSLLKLLSESYKLSHQDEKAVESLRVLVALDPKNLDYHRLFAQSLESIGDWDHSLIERDFITQAYQNISAPVPFADSYAHASCALNAKHPDLTLKICTDLLQRNPEDAQALIYSGKAYIQSGDTERGLNCLTQATQSSPENCESWLALVEVQKKLYPINTLIDTLANAAAAIPNSAEIHFSLGELYLQDGSPTLALPELKLAYTFSPEDPKILLSYGQTLKQVGHLENSREILSKAFSIEQAYPGLARLYADVLIELNRLEDAISPLEQLIDTKSYQDSSSYMDYAHCVLSLHKSGSKNISPMRALAALNEVVQIDPDRLEAKALIAETLVANGDNEMAFQAYREALDTSLIEDKDWRERLSYGFGCLSASLGKYDIAIAALQEAAQVNPNNPDAIKSLSDAYIASNLLEDAIRSARSLLVIDGDNPDQLAWFAKQVTLLLSEHMLELNASNALLSKSISNEALNAMAKAIELAPTRSDLLVLLGYLFASMGSQPEAEQTFTHIASLDFSTLEDLQSAAKYLSEVGKHDSAIACLEKGMVQAAKDGHSHEPALYISLAKEYVKNNDHTSAINSLEEALQVMPGNGPLLSQKIEILLNLGQSLDALNCIEAAIVSDLDRDVLIDFLFLAAKINRCIGDYSSAYTYIQKGINAFCERTEAKDSSNLPPQYKTQVAEVLRSLLQPEQASKILQETQSISRADFDNEQNYLDFVCLHTELALDLGEAIRSDIQDIQPESSNRNFSRVMAITARLMNKAGNYKQAEQIFQIALNPFNNNDLRTDKVHWTDNYLKYLTLNSLVEAGIELQLWDHVASISNRLLEYTSGEALSYLSLAKAIVNKAEFYNLCVESSVYKHLPHADAVAQESFNQFNDFMNTVKSLVDPYKDNLLAKGFDLVDDQIYRWQARANIAFKQAGELQLDPLEILKHQPTPSDACAMINHLHQLSLHSPDSDSISKIIKIARSHPRNPAILLHVALSICDDNPVDAMKSLSMILEQNPYAKNPMIAFCNVILARLSLKNERYDHARRAISNALEFWRDEPEWHRIAYQIEKQTGNITAGIDHLSEASILVPENITYQTELAEAYFEQASNDHRMVKQAQLTLENLLKIDSNNVKALVLLSKTFFLQNDHANAERYAREAQLLDPNRAEAYHLLSDIAIKNNDFQGAFEYANKAIQIDPKNTQSIIVLARSLAALGRHNEALMKVETALSAFPDCKQLHLERIRIVKEVNGARAGLNELRSLAESNTEDFQILSALAKSYIDVGEFENAIDTAQLALNTCTETTPHNEQANLHLLVGQILRQSGHLDQSIGHLSEAIQLAPDRLEPYLELGLAQKERREYQKALQIFEQATNIDPADPRALYQAGLALKESKDYKSSETMLRRAVSLAPHDLAIRRQLAAVVALNLVHNPKTGRN